MEMLLVTIHSQIKNVSSNGCLKIFFLLTTGQYMYIL